jgi:hypothetical protein
MELHRKVGVAVTVELSRKGTAAADAFQLAGL